MRTGIVTVPVRRVAAMAALALFAAPALAAQDAPDARRELVLGGPSAAGVLFPISARWSFRADGTVAGTVSGVGNGAGIGPSSSWNFVVGASVLRHVPGAAPLRTYLLARVGYQRSMPDGSPVTQNYSYGAGLGVQYRAHDRFALFSELTAQFSYSSAASGSYVTAWSTANRVGVTVRRRARPN